MRWPYVVDGTLKSKTNAVICVFAVKCRCCLCACIEVSGACVLAVKCRGVVCVLVMKCRVFVCLQ